MTFNPRSFFISIFLFLVLVVIATFVHDTFIRPFAGDVLVVIWLYFTCRAFLKTKSYQLALYVLVFAYWVEFTQYFQVVKLLGLEQYKVARIVLGSTFDPKDLLAYTVGWGITLILIQLKWTK
jgi:hypothetical protein